MHLFYYFGNWKVFNTKRNLFANMFPLTVISKENNIIEKNKEDVKTYQKV